MPPAAVLRRLALPALLLLALPACGDDPASPGGAIDNSYTATTFLVRPDGEQQIDVRAAGGFIQLTIDPSLNTTGQLVLPPSVTGSSPLVVSLAGTAVRSGNTVSFDLDADTFFRDLEFTLDGSTLRARDQRVGDAVFTITLQP